MIPLLLAAALFLQDDDTKKKDAEAKDKVEAFTKALSAKKKDDDVILAIEELGKTRHARILEALKGWLGRGSPDIRLAAGKEVSKYEKDKGAAEALLAAGSRTTEADVAAKMIRWIGDVRYRPIAKDVLKLLDHKSPDVAAAACDALGSLKAKVTVGPLIDLVRRLEQIKEDTGSSAPLPGPPTPGPAPAPKDDQKVRKDKVLPAAMQALKDITSESKKDGQEWTGWWQKNQSLWKEPEDK
jgi:hypothetical protein